MRRPGGPPSYRPPSPSASLPRKVHQDLDLVVQLGDLLLELGRGEAAILITGLDKAHDLGLRLERRGLLGPCLPALGHICLALALVDRHICLALALVDLGLGFVDRGLGFGLALIDLGLGVGFELSHG